VRVKRVQHASTLSIVALLLRVLAVICQGLNVFEISLETVAEPELLSDRIVLHRVDGQADKLIGTDPALLNTNDV